MSDLFHDWLIVVWSLRYVLGASALILAAMLYLDGKMDQ